MKILNTGYLNSKIKQILRLSGMQDNVDMSLFASKLDTINSNAFKNLLTFGFAKDDIASHLITYLGISSDNDALNNLLSNEFGKIVDSAISEYETKQKQTDKFNKLSKSPIDEASKEWSVENTGDIFTADITLDEFTEKFNTLSESSENSEDFQYINAIESIGADNFFNAIDTDKDGVLADSELNELLNQDGDDTSISYDEFNNVFNNYLFEEGITDNIELQQENENQEETGIAQAPQNDFSEAPGNTSDIPASSNINNVSAGSGSNSGSNSGSYSGSDNSQNSSYPSSTESEQPKETVEDLIKQKQQIIQDADSEIDKLNSELNELLTNTDVEQELKDNYNTAKTAYEDNEKAISDNEAKILSFDSNLHDITKSISALEGEKSTIKTDTGISETDTGNKTRLSAIEIKLKELNDSKTQIEAQKQALSNENDTLKINESTLKDNLDTAQKAIEDKLPDEIKARISSLKTQIDTLNADKETKVSQIDLKIQTLKTEEIEQSKKDGETAGTLESDPVGSKFVEDALKYNGMKGGAKFSTGNYGWCADFVTYVVREVAQQMGMSSDEAKELSRNHLGASPQKLVKKNQGHVIETKGVSTTDLQNSVKPGMAFICKGGGASGRHTGFVAKVNDDGTFISIEGNHGNKVCQVTRNLSDMYQFVDFTYLFA